MATPLENLQTSYAQLCAAYSAATLAPKPNYSKDGQSFSHAEYLANLAAQIKALREIPGVAPDTQPVFEVHDAGAGYR